MKKSLLRASAMGAALSAFAFTAAFAQDAAPAAGTTPPQEDGLLMDEIVVTAVVSQTSKMRSSVSVSALSADELLQVAPRNTAEIFRNIPGIRSEASGGEGNANIAVRGLPVASGGAKFLQLHEDGLPVLEFGDISFGNADIFLRADANVARVEAIRGGSASTLASNSPGGVINFISKTGEKDGGSLAITRGLDYDTTRGDFDFGGHIDENWRFHIGGFYREGEGPRNANYTAESGGQVKANLTREFEKGYARVYFKYLNDRAISFLPQPMLVSGSNSDPDIRSVPGLDMRDQTLHSALFLTNTGLDGNNNLRTNSLKDGMHPVSTAVGAEFKFDLAEGWSIFNKVRMAQTDGGFVSIFPMQVTGAQALATEIGGAGASLRYTDGTRITNPSALNGNGLATRVALFDVDINDFSNFANDFKLTRAIVAGDSTIDLTAGYYKARQNIEMDWVWNSYVMEVKGDNARLLDVVAADGTLQTAGGLLAYGVPYFGNCCTRRYDAQYDIDAPYVSAALEMGQWNIDASLRRDEGKARGSYTASRQAQVDVNRDGSISVPERSVSIIDTANPQPINYDWGYWSWSVGANYMINPDLSVFARASRGGRANADRLLFGRVRADGSVATEDAVDMVNQYEGGVKWRGDGISLFATGFFAKTQEQNFEATSQRFFDRTYEAKGIELEASYRYEGFALTAGGTWTDAEISKDALTPALKGNKPRRQADFIYQLTPSYSYDVFTVGANIIGTTKSYAQDSNELVMPAYTQVNLFADYAITEGLVLSVNVNNLFNAKGLTESEEGSITEGQTNIIRARSINGRTSTATLKYTF
ncbi:MULTISPECIES: TonB-dependent receptor domain-containing protein [unclassified Azospirillum]|uniref:TonB-dependent receptor domain-containing protein n=1 Tax=unclassified Azospirillum TaxID=2630922 RepID=UPI000B6D5308|nr:MULTISPECIES: TonB-dependent receptor [unclassified Azospirillum]SNS55955.1 Outer membrane receptor proteins, mostly Fe transport [Azospirillum sp. RU38E]SNS75553.1 Outer membrane receptor proteins, mostly Fe transport [Azospirillum sp. RU37A]